MNRHNTNIEIESVAKVLIVDTTNRALILTLGEHKKHPEKSFQPDLPGGIVEPGESTLSAAIRETKEETGITLDSKDMYLAYAKTDYFSAENKSVSKLLYVATLDELPEITLSWERSAYKWVLPDDLSQTMFSPFLREAIKYLLINNILE